MRRVIGIDIHRTFGEVVIWEDGRLRQLRSGRHDPNRARRAGREAASDRRSGHRSNRQLYGGFAGLSPFVQRVVIANPLQVKAIAHAHVKTDKVDAGDAGEPVRGRVSAGDLDP